MRVLTFDIEDWFHILEHEPTADMAAWPRFESRIRAGTERILAALERRGVKATFFCLGWVAEHHPGVVRAIADAGHEVGSHSYAHAMVHAQTPAEFEEDLERSLGVLGTLLGRPVTSYRAPGYSITARTPWAFEVLARNGIQTDASLFPTWRMHGGFRGAMRRPGWIETSEGRIREFPMTVTTVMGHDVPFSGGGYFRLCPSRIAHALVRREPYVMTYFHPRDFDRGQPLIPGLSSLRHARTYVGISRAFAKFERLLDAFDFIDVAEATRRVDWDTAPIMQPTQEAVPHWRVHGF